MKKQTRHKWFLIAILSTIVASPNAAVIHSLSQHYDFYAINAIRFGLAGLLFLSSLLNVPLSLLIKNHKDIILGGLMLSIAGMSYTIALQRGPASYTSIIMLLMPIMLMIYAVRIMHERMKRTQIAGISLAALGAVCMVLVPLLGIQGNDFAFYPVATIFSTISMLSFPLYTIAVHRANSKGNVPILALLAITNCIACALNTAAWVLFGSHIPAPQQPATWLQIIYIAFVVQVFSRFLLLKSYRYLPTPMVSIATYVESILAVALPVFILGEKLSGAMITGCCMILLGVFIVEHHKARHVKPFHVAHT
jgi:O-acetylserine/cysteine efflux transporter